MEEVEYRGCLIVPEARKNPSSGTWDVRLAFLCPEGRYPKHNPAYVPTSCNVKSEALEHSLDTGKKIIDREVEKRE